MDRGPGADNQQKKPAVAAHPDQGTPWADEAPTRPANPARPKPGSDRRVGDQSVGDAADVVSTAHPSVRPSGAPKSCDVDRWYESIRPPIPSLPELTLELRENAKRRRWLGWIAMTVFVGASVCIVVAAAIVRMRAQAPTAWLSYASPSHTRIALPLAVPNVRSTPPPAEPLAAQAPTPTVSSSLPTVAPSVPHRAFVPTQKTKRAPGSP